MSDSSLSARIVIAVSLLVFGALVIALWNFTVDDAFITFRYAEHLAAGYGPTFNKTGPPVEGYTSVLWMVLMALPFWLSIDPVVFSKIAGIFCLLGGIAICCRWVWRATDHLPATLRWVPTVAALAFLVCFAPTAIHAVSGMETALYTLMVVSFLYVSYLVLERRPTTRLLVVFASAALLLGLTRPDGNLVAAVGIATTFILVDRRSRPLMIGATICAYVIPGAVYFASRSAYYHMLLPLPFYLKVSHPYLLSGLLDVEQYVKYLAVHVGPLVIIALLRPSRRWIPALAAVTAVILFFVFPAHIMGFQWRFLFPVAPVIFVLASVGLAHVLSWLLARMSNPRGVALVGVGIMACLCAWLLSDVRAAAAERLRYSKSMAGVHIRLGKWLRTLDGRIDSPVLAIGDAGAVPYYSGWNTVDTFGLNDNEIARTGRHDPGYVLASKPDLLVLISSRKETFEPPLSWEQALYDLAKQQHYVLAATLQFTADYHLWLMVPMGSEMGAAIAEWNGSQPPR